MSLGKTVLLADDDAFVRQMLMLMLRPLGFTGQAVEDGEQALAALRTRQFDLLLLDVMMPHLDGMATLAAIRRAESRGPHRQKIIMVTAHEGPTIEQRLRDAGADGYLVKPLQAAQVARVVRQVCA